jgi:hypothetical protein
MAFLRDELKALSVVLSPTHRVSGSETADVLSALIAYVEDPGVLAAAQEGAQAVADFYHDRLTSEATSLGIEPPVRGQPIEQQPAPGRQGPAPAVSKTDFDRLTGLVEQLLAAQAASAAPESEPYAPPVTPDQYATQERAQGFPG